jgi:hypothetical protein
MADERGQLYPHMRFVSVPPNTRERPLVSFSRFAFVFAVGFVLGCLL